MSDYAWFSTFKLRYGGSGGKFLMGGTTHAKSFSLLNHWHYLHICPGGHISICSFSTPEFFWLLLKLVLDFCCLVAQSFPTLCSPMDGSPSGCCLSMESPRQEYWGGLPFLTSQALLKPGIQSMSLVSSALADGFLTTSTTWEALDF